MQEQSGVSRRQFLAVAAAGATLGLGGLLVHHQLDDDAYPASPYPHLNRRQLAVLRQLGRIWLPQGQGPFPAADDLNTWQNLARSLAAMPELIQSQLATALSAFDVAAMVYGWHGRSFARLEPDAAAAYVRRWQDGRQEQRSLIMALRQLVMVSYWRDPGSWPATGYLGPLHQRQTIAALGDAPEPERL